MWSLVYKDFYQQRKGLRFLLLWGIGLFAFTALSDAGLGMIPLFIFIAGTNFALRFSYHEEKNHGLSFLRSLPLKPNYIVGSKYVAALLMGILGIVFTVVCVGVMLLMGFVSLGLSNVQEILLLILVPLYALLIFNGMFFPLYFRQGYIRAQGTVRIFVLVFAVVVAGSLNKLENHSQILAFSGILGPNTWLWVTLAVVGLYLLSYVLSLRIFMKRDL